MRLVFDIEADGFLDTLTTIHCMVAKDIDTDVIHKFRPHEIKKGLKLLQDASMLIAHNGLDYDIRAIKKLYPRWTTKAYLYDTLVAAKVAFPDIKERDFKIYNKIIKTPATMRSELDKKKMRNIGRHSLEAYGLRMNEHKGDFGKEVGFDVFSEEMLEYCVQDVNVNTKLYHKLVQKELDKDILDTEFQAQQICLEQTEFGFDFDIDKATKLQEELEGELEKLQDEIKSELGGVFIMPLEVKVPKRTVRYKEVLRGNEFVGCPYTKIKLKEFNPTSRHHLATRLIERKGWKPKEFGDDNKPTLSETVLIKQEQRIFKVIAKQMMIQKRLGMLAEGQNAWIKLYNEETKSIHGRINTLGAGTSRATHSKPNLAQIPSTRSPYGKECRELFTVPKDWKLFGTDAAGLELRMLAHYMARYDNGEYGRIILTGDIHTANQTAAGLPTRNDAKTFIYAFLYGAGNGKLGSIVGGTSKDGGKLKERFYKATPAIKSLREAVENAAERGWIKGLDGRKIPVRSTHSALNFLLQGAGAIVCKRWMVEFHKLLKEFGHTEYVKQSAWVHDELQLAFDPTKITGEVLGDISRQAMKAVQKAYDVKIDLDIDWDIGDSYAETH